jgi:hypothetical protein
MVIVILADKPGSSYCSRMQCALDNGQVPIFTLKCFYLVLTRKLYV